MRGHKSHACSRRHICNMECCTNTWLWNFYLNISAPFICHCSVMLNMSTLDGEARLYIPRVLMPALLVQRSYLHGRARRTRVLKLTGHSSPNLLHSSQWHSLLIPAFSAPIEDVNLTLGSELVPQANFVTHGDGDQCRAICHLQHLSSWQ